MSTNNQIKKGHEHQTGDLVTAESLNNIADEATLLRGSISEQPAIDAVEPSDEVLINDTSDTSTLLPKKATVQQIVEAVAGEFFDLDGISVQKITTPVIAAPQPLDSIRFEFSESVKQRVLAQGVTNAASKKQNWTITTTTAHGLSVDDIIGMGIAATDDNDPVDVRDVFQHARVTEVLATDVFKCVVIEETKNLKILDDSDYEWLPGEKNLLVYIKDQINPVYTGQISYIKTGTLLLPKGMEIVEETDPDSGIVYENEYRGANCVDFRNSLLLGESVSIRDGLIKVGENGKLLIPVKSSIGPLDPSYNESGSICLNVENVPTYSSPDGVIDPYYPANGFWGQEGKLHGFIPTIEIAENAPQYDTKRLRLTPILVNPSYTELSAEHPIITGTGVVTAQKLNSIDERDIITSIFCIRVVLQGTDYTNKIVNFKTKFRVKAFFDWLYVKAKSEPSGLLPRNFYPLNINVEIGCNFQKTTSPTGTEDVFVSKCINSAGDYMMKFDSPSFTPNKATINLAFYITGRRWTGISSTDTEPTTLEPLNSSYAKFFVAL